MLANPKNAMIIITHFSRILEYIVPDRVHICYDGLSCYLELKIWPLIWKNRAMKPYYRTFEKRPAVNYFLDKKKQKRFRCPTVSMI